MGILDIAIRELAISQLKQADETKVVQGVETAKQGVKQTSGFVSPLDAVDEQRKRGEIPAHYTATVICIRCGKVPIFPCGLTHVKGCPWCLNRR